MVCLTPILLSLPKAKLTITLHSNKADLAIINRIRAEIKPPSKQPNRNRNHNLAPIDSDRHYPLIIRPPQHQQHQQKPPRKSHHQHKQHQQQLIKTPPQRNPHLRLALNTVRCIVRLQLGAHAWAKQERVRRKLAECFDGMQREERIRLLGDVWRGNSGGVVARGGGGGGRGVLGGEDEDGVC